MTEPQLPAETETEVREMNPGVARQLPAESFDGFDDGFDDVLPVRPRPRYLTPLTALLMALILGGAGFYAGVRVEKAQTPAAGGGASALARALGGGRGHKHGSRAAAALAGGGLGSRLAAALGRGGGTAGSVSAIDGNTLYVKEANGNTVAVKLSAATRITKSEPASRSRIFPGDQVVVSGSGGPKGTVDAASVSDSGAGAGGSGTGTGGSGSSSATSSAISALFGGG